MEVIQKLILPQGNFPGNSRYPLLIYKRAISTLKKSPSDIQDQLQQNNWRNPWIDSIYDYHHFHSNTHEVLVIVSGECQVQFGGEEGSTWSVTSDDVILIPAGVAHKSVAMDEHFRCIGAYPLDIGYDLFCGKAEEYSMVVENIQKVGLPEKDPIFGEHGVLFKYWQ